MRRVSADQPSIGTHPTRELSFLPPILSSRLFLPKVMAEEETFDIYGDDDTTSPSSPSQQSGPKKRLRRERSSSAPPLISPQDDEDDGASTPRQKKVKEDDDQSDEEEDPFKEYDNHVPLAKVCVCLCVV